MLDNHKDHCAQAVQIGGCTVLAGGLNYLKKPGDFGGIDVLIPLETRRVISLDVSPLEVGQEVRILGCPWPDFSPPPPELKWLLEERVIPLLKEGKTVLVFCAGGHGRTGTFLASLLALLEPDIKDPVAEIRTRYCSHAVETDEQARAVFALVGKDVPEVYREDPEDLEAKEYLAYMGGTK